MRVVILPSSYRQNLKLLLIQLRWTLSFLLLLRYFYLYLSFSCYLVFQSWPKMLILCCRNPFSLFFWIILFHLFLMIWALKRYVHRYRLTDRPLANTPLWSAPWIKLWRASQYSIIKIIRQLENSKSIWLYLFYSLIITITIMSDGGALFRVQSDAQARMKAQMQEISIHKNGVGGYE